MTKADLIPVVEPKVGDWVIPHPRGFDPELTGAGPCRVTKVTRRPGGIAVCLEGLPALVSSWGDRWVIVTDHRARNDTPPPPPAC